MKKREMMQAVRRVYPLATAFTRIDNGRHQIDAGGLSLPAEIVGAGPTEYTAWADAWQRIVRADAAERLQGMQG